MLNFQNGTVYRNVGPRRSGDADNMVSELFLVTLQNGRRTMAEFVKLGASGHYRWDLFHRAIHGEPIAGEISPERMVAGIRIVRAMTEALRTGRAVRVA